MSAPNRIDRHALPARPSFTDPSALDPSPPSAHAASPTPSARVSHRTSVRARTAPSAIAPCAPLCITTTAHCCEIVHAARALVANDRVLTLLFNRMRARNVRGSV